jgi:hypothetical protein
MNKKEILDDLSKVASESKPLDKEMSDDIDKLARHLATALTDEELDEMTEKNASLDKDAKLIEQGQTVVCVDNFPPLFKGRRYVVSDASIPGFICVKEQTGEDVGVFAVNRFSIEWFGQ